MLFSGFSTPLVLVLLLQSKLLLCVYCVGVDRLANHLCHILRVSCFYASLFLTRWDRYEWNCFVVSLLYLLIAKTAADKLVL